LSNAEIGNTLFLSEATVKAHVSRLLSKLDLNNRVQIAMLVHDAGAALIRPLIQRAAPPGGRSRQQCTGFTAGPVIVTL